MQSQGRAQNPQRVAATGAAPRHRRKPSVRAAGAEAMRLCVVCRESREVGALVQLKFADTGKQGRSAYVCVAKACLEKVHSKVVSRSLKGPVGALDGTMTQNALRDLAQARLLALFGLARRCNDLVFGVEAVAEAAQKAATLQKDTGLWFVASDVAARSARKLQAAHVFLSSHELGAAVGMGAVGALGLTPGRLAKQAAYWLRVWYETQSREQLAETSARSQAASGYQQHGSGQGTPTRD